MQISTQVRINDVMGKTVGPLTVTVDKAVHLPTKGVVINKKQMTTVAGDKYTVANVYFWKFL